MEMAGLTVKWKLLLLLLVTYVPYVQGTSPNFKDDLRTIIPFILGALILCILLGILCWFQCRWKKIEKCFYVYCKKSCFSHETIEDQNKLPSSGAYTQQTLTNVVTHNCRCQSISIQTSAHNEESLHNKSQNSTQETPNDTYICSRHTSESLKNDKKVTGTLRGCQCKVFQQTCSCACQPLSVSTGQRPVDKDGPLFTVIS